MKFIDVHKWIGKTRRKENRFLYLAVDGYYLDSLKGTGSEGESGFVCATVETIRWLFEHPSQLRELQQLADIFNIGRPSYRVPEHGSCHEVLGMLEACCAIKLP